jgi:hypothetical protein
MPGGAGQGAPGGGYSYPGPGGVGGTYAGPGSGAYRDYGRGRPPLRERPRGPGRLDQDGAAGYQSDSGHLIRQRDTALADQRRIGGTQPTMAIAPDGLESFARDLRALRAKAELDYPEMAERSHYTMKTLASAAGGIRLPTLPVAMAFVRACGGEVTEWEDRWHKLAEKYAADGAEPGEKQAEPSGPPLGGAGPGPAGGDEVYVITSAKPREPGW